MGHPAGAAYDGGGMTGTNPAWWAEAGREFVRRLDALARRDRSRPDWAYLNDLALDEDNLAHVLVDMGFTDRWGCWPAAEFTGWPGCFGDVYEMGIGKERIFLIDTGSGRWRTVDNCQRDRDLISLGALLWGVSYGRAGRRIARACGFDRIPDGSWRERGHAGR